jgi:hypothetical protein
MTYDKKENEYILDSGRRVYANGGILGLGLPDGEHCIGGVSHGSDGGFDTADWTEDERYEIADEMIVRWMEFAKGNR